MGIIEANRQIRIEHEENKIEKRKSREEFIKKMQKQMNYREQHGEDDDEENSNMIEDKSSEQQTTEYRPSHTKEKNTNENEDTF